MGVMVCTYILTHKFTCINSLSLSLSHTLTHTETEHSLVNLGDDYAHMKEVFPLEGLHLANMRETMCVKGSKDGESERERVCVCVCVCVCVEI